MENVIFYGVVLLIVIHFLFTMYANMLNDKERFKKIPDNVNDIYDEDSYKTWLKYSSELNQIGFIKNLIKFVFVVLMLVNGGFLDIAQWTSEITNNNIYGETLLFIGVLFGINFVYDIPFSYYHTFSIEERYGFNRSTPKTFITDKIKNLIMGGLLSFGILTLLIWIYDTTGQWFIVIALVSVMTIFLFINITYTTLFVPLFNKLTPLEDGDLKTKIEAYAESQNYAINKVQVIDASKRSSKLNAFFSGFGKFKNIVLFDTLIEKMDDDAIVSVLAHEIGHAKHKDVIRNIFTSFITLGVMLALFYGFVQIDVFYEAFNLDALHLGFMLMIFSFLLSPVSMLIGVLMNKLSRIAEHKADKFAADTTSKEAMIRALKVLSKENFSQLTPHKLFVILNYSHPPVTTRINHIDT